MCVMLCTVINGNEIVSTSKYILTCIPNRASFLQIKAIMIFKQCHFVLSNGLFAIYIDDVILELHAFLGNYHKLWCVYQGIHLLR